MLLFIGFLFIIFAPLELYLVNSGEFWFGLSDFVGYHILAFLTWTLFAFILSKQRKKWIKTAIYYLFVVAVSLYIQGNFVIIDYGQLDGEPIIWENFRKEGIISLAVFSLVIILGIIVHHFFEGDKLYRVLDRVSFCLILMLIITIISLLIGNEGIKKNEYVVTDKDKTVYSENENVIVIVLDTYDSRVLNDLVSERDTDVQSTFRNFTFYKNTTSMYRYTDYSLPEIITGIPFVNQSSFDEYLVDSYRNSPLLNGLAADDYKVYLYIDNPIPKSEINDAIKNINKGKIEISSHRRLIEYMYKLVAFRYFPQQIKKFFWTYTDEIDDIREIKYMDEDIEPVRWGNDSFRDGIQNTTTGMKDKKFALIHLQGIHDPRDLNKDLESVNEEVDIYESARACNKILNLYFDKLKELGIYDSSVIIIMADHGAPDYDEYRMAQCPILLIKNRYEEHELVIDDIPISYSEIQKVFLSVISKGDEQIEPKIQTSDERIYYRIDFDSGKKGLKNTGPRFVEYSISGHAYDTNSIIPTGKEY